MEGLQKENRRKAELINATLRCIAAHGVENTTVRRIAEYAGVTNGLVRFYFDSKINILRQSFAQFLSELFCFASLAVGPARDGGAESRLRAFVIANLSPPIIGRESVLIWASYIPLTHKDAELAKIHAAFRASTVDAFAEMICAYYHEAGRGPDPTRVRERAAMLSCLIDGLWLEGSSVGPELSGERLRTVGSAAAFAILDAP